MAGTVQTFLKVLIGANTKGFRKDMSEGEKAVQKFASETRGALNKFAEVFGVDLEGMRKQSKGFIDSLNNMGKGLKAASIGTTGLSTALKILKVALLATGIGALIVVLGSLATYFTKSESGSKALRSEMAQLKAVGEVLIDRFAMLGKSLVMLWQGRAVEGSVVAKNALIGIGKALQNASIQAKLLSDTMYDLEYAERQFNVTSSEQEIKLEELRLAARDLDLTASERLKNLVAAGAIEKKINKEALALASERILAAQITLQIDEDDKDAKDALAQAYVNYNNMVKQSIVFDRQLTREKNALVKEIKSENEAQLEALRTMKEANQLSKVGVNIKPEIPGMNDLRPYTGTMVTSLGEVSDEMKDMYSATEQSIENVAMGFGEWVGAFSSGLAGFRGMRQLVGNAFGDMLIQLGQVAIRTGIGIEAIKKALSNPFTAGIGTIAVGAGLVAFGSSIKGSIAQINNARSAAGSGSYPASSMGGSATFGSLSQSARGKLLIEGNVKLTLSGSDLKALLDNENARIEIIT
ncbi:MAG TPA: hypothetical protein VK213_13530 [Bacteroidales bacterium]|nr:hypothetical protein [Bacteroidales bacterium]